MRIFVAPAALAAGELTVRGDEHHYLARVRRARAGDAIELVDGAGRRAAATIARITDDATTLIAEPPTEVAAAAPRVIAVVCTWRSAKSSPSAYGCGIPASRSPSILTARLR